MTDVLEQLTASAMQRYDRVAQSEADPDRRAGLLRDRSQAEAMIRDTPTIAA